MIGKETKKGESIFGCVFCFRRKFHVSSFSLSVGALPEIRHKTAISTIRSTAEKNLSKERLQKFKNEEKAKKDKSKKDSTSK